MNYYITKICKIVPFQLVVNNQHVYSEESPAPFAAFMKSLYQKFQVSYTKFYKMDGLSKLGFITAEILFKDTDFLAKYNKDSIGLIVQNSSSTLLTDTDFQNTISDRAKYFPSPSVFVYTLPNIMLGEICIRHQIKGENAVFIEEKFDPAFLISSVAGQFKAKRMDACVAGWIEYNNSTFEAFLALVEPEDRVGSHPNPIALDPENIAEVFQS